MGDDSPVLVDRTPNPGRRFDGFKELRGLDGFDPHIVVCMLLSE